MNFTTASDSAGACTVAAAAFVWLSFARPDTAYGYMVVGMVAGVAAILLGSAVYFAWPREQARATSQDPIMAFTLRVQHAVAAAEGWRGNG